MARRLDRGGGKDLSLKECPREQLEKERITYLSPEQRRVIPVSSSRPRSHASARPKLSGHNR
ncbi:hypothetical protein BC628DRAFT_1354718 [Trametes gibbosa]|nr:hypothetical protein BC628DRAFT_1354718 [Trametes gibbosa]